MPQSYHVKLKKSGKVVLTVPPELCLLGCVFVITEYQDTVPDVKIIEHWKKVGYAM